jgi:hypothetical protein
VKLNATPTPAAPGAVTEKCVAGPAFTTAIALLVPAIAEFTVSAAVMVRLPLVRIVAWKVPEPLLSTAFAGSVAALSLLLKCTVPL